MECKKPARISHIEWRQQVGWGGIARTFPFDPCGPKMCLSIIHKKPRTWFGISIVTLLDSLAEALLIDRAAGPGPRIEEDTVVPQPPPPPPPMQSRLSPIRCQENHLQRYLLHCLHGPRRSRPALFRLLHVATRRRLVGWGGGVTTSKTLLPSYRGRTARETICSWSLYVTLSSSSSFSFSFSFSVRLSISLSPSLSHLVLGSSTSLLFPHPAYPSATRGPRAPAGQIDRSKYCMYVCMYAYMFSEGGSPSFRPLGRRLQ